MVAWGFMVLISVFVVDCGDKCLIDWVKMVGLVEKWMRWRVLNTQRRGFKLQCLGFNLQRYGLKPNCFGFNIQCFGFKLHRLVFQTPMSEFKPQMSWFEAPTFGFKPQTFGFETPCFRHRDGLERRFYEFMDGNFSRKAVFHTEARRTWRDFSPFFLESLKYYGLY